MVYGSACRCHADLVLSDYLVYYSCVHATDNANFFSLLSAIHVIADIDPFYLFIFAQAAERACLPSAYIYR